MRKHLLGMLAVALAGAPVVANASAANCGAGDTPLSVSADITTNTTWSGTVVLELPIFVRGGAILTILPGTIVRGQPRTAVVQSGVTAGTPGALIVTNTGRIIADGTPTNSIILTTAAVDNNNDGNPDDDDANGFLDAWVPGDQFLDDECGAAPLAPLAANGTANTNRWGGLVIAGNAPNNTADGIFQVEGLSVPGFTPAFAECGGNEPHDNSGRLQYVSIRHAGDEIGTSNELNGLTLCSVGDGTKISNVEVYANYDDGFEWFGGTVNADHLSVAFAGDDSFDIDLGYTGVNQFLFAVMNFFDQDSGASFGTGSSDKLGEWDGDNFDEGALDVCLRADGTPCPFPGADFFNLTAIGSTPDGVQESTSFDPTSANRGVQVRHCGAARLFNSVIVNTGTAEGFDVDGTMPGGTACATGHNVTDHTTQGLIALVCSTLDDVNGGSVTLGATEEIARSNGNSLSVLLGVAATGSANAVNPATFDIVNDDTTFDTVGVAGKLAASLKASNGPINPRLVTGGLGRPNAGCAVPPAPLDSSAVYRGAFAIGAPSLWTTDWTALNQGGILAD
jgi:hypothetical protein